MSHLGSFNTIEVRLEPGVCFARYNQPDNDNAITTEFIRDLYQLLESCQGNYTVLVLEGSRETFCSGADFNAIKHSVSSEADEKKPYDTQDPELLYELWKMMQTSPCIVISHIEGRANAGGMGFVAASDVVIANNAATFGLSELLFGLMPACVLPFLIRKVGVQRAHYLTLRTKAISAKKACEWGLVDAVGEDSKALLRQHLLRFRRLPTKGVEQYKKYMGQLIGGQSQEEIKQLALAVNRTMFNDPENIAGIKRYVEQGILPWEKEE